MKKMKVCAGDWEKVEGRKLTDAERIQLAEADRLFYLEVERQRKERLAALSNVPRDRLLD